MAPSGDSWMTEAELKSLGYTDDDLVNDFARAYGMNIEIVDDRVRRQTFDAVMRALYDTDNISSNP